ncbi:hypothetical protein SAMN04488085_1098 [Geodermatophilus ruber]|uniref:Uncharacterized protein n=1 Tax=Geodermatophilus ruber TaxID=504800 RepID=A0A1I4GJ99_9ACTN|nr:hypothetical protein SAMN04488085_1098 [Geodermatophilus ruber]
MKTAGVPMMATVLALAGPVAATVVGRQGGGALAGLAVLPGLAASGATVCVQPAGQLGQGPRAG